MTCPRLLHQKNPQQESHGIQNWSNGREFSKGVLIKVWAGLRNINKDCWNISRLIMELWVLKEQGEGYPELTATVAFGGCREVVGTDTNLILFSPQYSLLAFHWVTPNESQETRLSLVIHLVQFHWAHGEVKKDGELIWRGKEK